MIPALATSGLTKRYGGVRALRDCSLQIPAGRIVGLVGPNGAGKTTLLHLAVGLLTPTAGSIQVFGWSPREQPTLVLARVGFVAQDRPLYKRFRVSELLEMGRRLNPRWDAAIPRARMQKLAIPLDRPLRALSIGQQAQVALALALGKRPELLLLDEPVSSLDPLARRELLQELMDAVAQDGLTVVLSSHIVSELERVCDYLLILSSGQVQVAGDIEELLRRHRLLVGARCDPAAVARDGSVIHASHTARQSSLLVCTNAEAPTARWFAQKPAEDRSVSLEELVLAYLSRPASGSIPAAEPKPTEVSA